MLYPPTVSLFPSHNPSNHTTPLPAGEGQGVGLLSKTTPFAFQNDSFYLPKGLLLPTKTNPFATQKDSFFLVFNF